MTYWNNFHNQVKSVNEHLYHLLMVDFRLHALRTIFTSFAHLLFCKQRPLVLCFLLRLLCYISWRIWSTFGECKRKSKFIQTHLNMNFTYVCTQMGVQYLVVSMYRLSWFRGDSSVQLRLTLLFHPRSELPLTGEGHIQKPSSSNVLVMFYIGVDEEPV